MMKLFPLSLKIYYYNLLNTGFNKCNRKWKEKVSGMWVLFLYTSLCSKGVFFDMGFKIIKSELSEKRIK